MVGSFGCLDKMEFCTFRSQMIMTLTVQCTHTKLQVFLHLCMFQNLGTYIVWLLRDCQFLQELSTYLMPTYCGFFYQKAVAVVEIDYENTSIYLYQSNETMTSLIPLKLQSVFVCPHTTDESFAGRGRYNMWWNKRMTLPTR